MSALRALLVLAVLVAMTGAALMLALAVGSEPLTLSAVWAALEGRGQGLARNIVLDLRLPRALAALATGGLLALAGALMQVLLRNPLADPYILGVSGGAAVAALGALMVGLGGLSYTARRFGGALRPCCSCSRWRAARAAGPPPGCCSRGPSSPRDSAPASACSSRWAPTAACAGCCSGSWATCRSCAPPAAS